jgi:hypothetical protein
MMSHLMSDPIEHKASMEAGKAWQWMKKTQARTMQEWLKIGQGFMTGRAWAMRRAGTNQPAGRGYNEAFGEWLVAYKLDDIDQADRSNLFKLMETPAAMAWRNGLSESKRNALNHPTTILRAYKRATTRVVDEAATADAAALKSIDKPALTAAAVAEPYNPTAGERELRAEIEQLKAKLWEERNTKMAAAADRALLENPQEVFPDVPFAAPKGNPLKGLDFGTIVDFILELPASTVKAIVHDLVKATSRAG